MDTDIAHLEGHLEELFALTDCEQFIERSYHVSALAHDAIERGANLIAVDVEKAFKIITHAAEVLRKIAFEQQAHFMRLRDKVIPEVQKCYQYAETRYGLTR